MKLAHATIIAITMSIVVPSAHANRLTWLDDVLRGGTKTKTLQLRQRAQSAENALATQRRHQAEIRVTQLARQESQRAAQRAHQLATKKQAQTLQQQFSQVRDPHVIYQRVNPITGRYYVGRAQSTRRYLERQNEHNRAAGAQHNFSVTTTAPTRQSARVAEETSMRVHRNNPATGNNLENRRWEMNNDSYHLTGGHVQRSASSPNVTGHSSRVGSPGATSSSFNSASGAATGMAR